MAKLIQFKRGNTQDFNQTVKDALQPGEPVFILDTEELVIGKGAGAVFAVGNMLKSVYDTNNDGVIDLAENANALNGKADTYFQKAIPAQTTTPETPAENDYWLDTSNASKFVLKRYDGSKWDVISGGTVTNTEIETALGYVPAALDGGGKVLVSQIPTTFKELKVVADIAARDALADPYEGLRAHVLDASADASVTSGWAEYMYTGSSWTKIAENESIDVQLTWDAIQNKPTFTNVEASTTNGYIKIDTVETKVYEHPATHTLSEVADFPTFSAADDGKLLKVNATGNLEFAVEDTGVDGGTF